jgi:hypothetical protein
MSTNYDYTLESRLLQFGVDIKPYTTSGKYTRKYKSLLAHGAGVVPTPRGTVYNRTTGRIIQRKSLFAYAGTPKERLRKSAEKKVFVHENEVISATKGIHRETHTKKSSAARFTFVDFPLDMALQGGQFTAASVQNIVERIGTRPGHRFQIRLQGTDSTGDTAAQHAYLLAYQQSSYEKAANRLNKIMSDESYDDKRMYTTIRASYVIDVPTIGQGGMKLQGRKSASERWYIFDSKADSNCFWRALYICMNARKAKQLSDKESERLITNGAAQLKKSYSHLQPNPNFVDTTNIQAFVDKNAAGRKQFAVQLYSNLFEKTHYFQPTEGKKFRTYHIQLRRNHFIPLLPWGEIPDMEYVETCQKAVDDLVETKVGSDEPTLIKEPSFPKRNRDPDAPLHGADRRERTTLDDHIVSWDIESTPNGLAKGVFTPFSVGCSWVEEGEQKHKQWWGLDCMHEFGEFVGSYQHFDGATFYAHNGGKFDLPQLISGSFARDDSSHTIEASCELNSRYISMSTRSKEGVKITWRDSMCHLVGSLDKNCQSFAKEIGCVQKMTGAVDHDEVTLENCLDHERFPKFKDYLRNDCDSLLQIMLAYARTVHDNYNVNITSCATAASFSKKLFMQNYYDSRKTQIHRPSDSQDEFIRASYYGGRVECHYLGTFKGLKVYYYDYTSHYPSEMAKRKYVYGKPFWITDPRIVEARVQTRTLHGTVEVRCRTKPGMEDELPLHCVFDPENPKLVFPVIENWRTMIITTEELYEGIDSGIYEYEFQRAVGYPSRSKWLRQYIMDLFERKAQAKKEKKKSLESSCKIAANSGYGWWGIRWRGKTGVEHGPPGDWVKHFEAGKLLHTTERGNLCVSNVEKDLDIPCRNVSVAAAVAANARIRIWRMMRDMKKKGLNVLYCDTDSVIVDGDLKKHPDLMAEYMWDGTGKALGALKNEADDLFEKPEEHPEWSDTSSIAFDELRVCALKMYSLVKHASPDGKYPEKTIMKCKGFSKNNGVVSDRSAMAMEGDGLSEKEIEEKTHDLCIQDYERILQGHTMYQDQTQFRCPITNHVSEQRFMHITKAEVRKGFKVVYTKGSYDKEKLGWVKPLRV